MEQTKGPAQGLDGQGSISQSQQVLLRGLFILFLHQDLSPARSPKLVRTDTGDYVDDPLAALAKVGRCICVYSSFQQTSLP